MFFSLLEYAKNSVQEKSTYPAIETADVAIADSEKKYYKEGHKKASKFCEAICALAAYVKQLNPRCIETVYNLGDRLSLAKAGTLREYWSETELSGSLLDGYQQQLAFSTHSQLAQAPVCPATDDLYKRVSAGILDETKTSKTASCEVQQSIKEAEIQFKQTTGEAWTLDHKFDAAVARVARIPGQGFVHDSLKAAVRDAACPPGQLPKTWRKVVLGSGSVETSRAERVTQHVLGVFHAYSRAEEEA